MLSSAIHHGPLQDSLNNQFSKDTERRTICTKNDKLHVSVQLQHNR